MRARSVLTVCACMGAAVAQAQTASLAPTDPRFALLTHAIVDRYWKPLSRDSVELVLRTRGLEGLDPYSGLMSPSDEAQLRVGIAGRFVGIGALLRPDSATGQPRVTDAFVDSPALAAGVRAEDVVLSVDGAPTKGLTLDSIVPKLRGVAGTTVVVEVRHRNDANPVRLAIVRAPIPTPSVRGMARTPGGPWSYRAGDGATVAYARITSFTATTAGDLDTVLRAATRSGASALILDLRGNIGGLVTAAVDAADLFLDSGTVVTVRSRTESHERRARPGVATTLPTVALIDERTISAAELFVAALQDNHRVIVVGQRSFGKGLVQQIIPLGGELGSVRLSTDEYVRPSGRIIERHAVGGDDAKGGVWPDSGNDVVESKAVLTSQAERLEADDVQALLAHGTIAPIARASDPALARALDVLAAKVRR